MNKSAKKLLVLIVVFFFIFIGFQPVFANEPTEKVTDSKTDDIEKIEYPKTDSEYIIAITGPWINAYFQDPLMLGQDGFYSIGPFIFTSGHILLGFVLGKGCILSVNGVTTIIKEITYLVIFGFHGYHPGIILYLLKYPLFSWNWRYRCFGGCDFIDILSK